MKPIVLLFIMLFIATCVKAQNLIPVPQIFQPGIISTGDYESHPAFTPSGDTLYFIKCSYDLKISNICVSYRVNGKWASPQVASFSGIYMDSDPFVTKDGRELYYMSNRPLKKGSPVKDDTDLWKVVRTKNGWSDPINLGPVVNSTYDEYYPTLADNGDLYFGSPRPGGKGGSDIWCCKYVNGQYQPAINLGDAINTPGNDYEAFIAPDESYIIYNSTPGTLRHLHFYISYNQNGMWTKAKMLPEPLNSDDTDWSPKVTRDKKLFYFSSLRNKSADVPLKPQNISELNRRLESAGNSLADIYTVDFSAIANLK
jgi:hypothetical protein